MFQRELEVFLEGRAGNCGLWVRSSDVKDQEKVARIHTLVTSTYSPLLETSWDGAVLSVEERAIGSWDVLFARACWNNFE